MKYVATAVSVKSVEQSIEFYCGVLGFTEWFRFGEGPLVAAGLERGAGRIIVSRTEQLSAEQLAGRGPGVSLYVGMDSSEDIDALWERVKVLEPIADRYWGDRTFTVADPDGFPVEMSGEKG